MKIVKGLMILVLVYVGIVAGFETLLGIFQPQNQSTLIISTKSEEGIEKDRILARLNVDDQLYVAANHWPRAWYRQVLDRPAVRVTLDGKQGAYLAVSVSGDEHDRVNEKHKLGLGFRILTGFPPRYFVRLDPQP